MIRPLALLIALAPLAGRAAAQDWALDGIDPVAYSTAGSAVPGRADIVTLWRGKAWHFASPDNRDRFEANPRAYTPELGGLCVVALAEGRAEPGNPRYFAVIGQRTYLLRSEAARRRLLTDPAPVLERARAAWARLQH